MAGGSFGGWAVFVLLASGAVANGSSCSKVERPIPLVIKNAPSCGHAAYYDIPLAVRFENGSDFYQRAINGGGGAEDELRLLPSWFGQPITFKVGRCEKTTAGADCRRPSWTHTSVITLPRASAALELPKLTVRCPDGRSISN